MKPEQERTLVERLAFAHLCTGEELFKEAAQEIDRLEQELEEARK